MYRCSLARIRDHISSITTKNINDDPTPDVLPCISAAFVVATTGLVLVEDVEVVDELVPRDAVEVIIC